MNKIIQKDHISDKLCTCVTKAVVYRCFSVQIDSNDCFENCANNCANQIIYSYKPIISSDTEAGNPFPKLRVVGSIPIYRSEQENDKN